MAFDLPTRRITEQQVRTSKRNVPIDQILAVQGQSPIASGIDVAGNMIGQTLQRRAELQHQGKQLAQLEALSGEQPGAQF